MTINAVIRNLSLVTASSTASAEAAWEIAITHLLWPPLLWLVHLTAMVVPLSYAVFGYDAPNREDLLVCDERGVSRPETFRGTPRYEGVGWNAEHAQFFVMIYSLLVAWYAWAM